MATVNGPLNPCALGHEELGLMRNMTTFRDVDTVMMCTRCGKPMTFENAVRNDERIRWAAAFAAMANEHRSGARTWLGKGSNPVVGLELVADHLRLSDEAPSIQGGA
jgi:hypothetical protein